MMRRRRFASRRGVRKGTEWVRFVEDQYIGIPAATKVLLNTVAPVVPIQLTVIRTRGRISVFPDNGTAGVAMGAVGFLIADGRQTAAGAAALPGPVTDASSDEYFVWEPFNCTSLLIGTDAGLLKPSDPFRVDFDSKAARRLGSSENVAIMVENASSTLAFNIAVSFSLLVKVNT